MGKTTKGSVLLCTLMLGLLFGTTACAVSKSEQICSATMGRDVEAVDTLDRSTRIVLANAGYRFAPIDGEVCGIIAGAYTLYPAVIGKCSGAFIHEHPENGADVYFISRRGERGEALDQIHATTPSALPSALELIKRYAGYSMC